MNAKSFMSLMSAMMISFTGYCHNGAELKFISQRCINAGKIQEGIIKEYTFTFKNTGDEPLIILDDFPTCNYTDVEYEKQIYRAGEDGCIKVRIDTSNKLGQQTFVVRLLTNTEIESYIIRIDMDVYKDIL